MKITQEYVDGYTKALLDVYQIFSQYEGQFSRTREISINSSQKIRGIVDAMIDSRMQCIRHGVKAMTLVRLKDKTYRLKLKET